MPSWQRLQRLWLLCAALFGLSACVVSEPSAAGSPESGRYAVVIARDGTVWAAGQSHDLSRPDQRAQLGSQLKAQETSAAAPLLVASERGTSAARVDALLQFLDTIDLAHWRLELGKAGPGER